MLFISSDLTPIHPFFHSFEGLTTSPFACYLGNQIRQCFIHHFTRSYLRRYNRLNRKITVSQLLTEELSFNQSAVYQISVSGNLDKSWSSRLANMQISLEKNLADKNIYLLIGKLKDQAELNGILNTLYDLHLTLMSIKIIGKDR